MIFRTLKYLRDALIAWRLMLAVVRRRGKTVEALREQLAASEYARQSLDQQLESVRNENATLKATNRNLEADLEVARKEIEGVARAHDVLCRMLESQSAFYTRKAQSTASK